MTTTPITARGRAFKGRVISTKMSKTATIEWSFQKYVPKYERYIKGRTRVKAHVPENLLITVGDIVDIQECRPLSKTKRFIITKKYETTTL